MNTEKRKLKTSFRYYFVVAVQQCLFWVYVKIREQKLSRRRWVSL